MKTQVIRADALISYIKECDRFVDYAYTDEEMQKIAEFFLKNNVSERSDYSLKYKEIIETVKENNENNIQQDMPVENTEEIEKICPRCGEKLVLRIAKKGGNAGNEFWGCSAFPKCRYVENSN